MLLAAGCSSGPTPEASSTDMPAKTTTTGTPDAAPTMVAFADVKTILDAKCIGCHGEGGKGGIDLRSYESLMKGGGEGTIVKAGDAEHSELVEVLKTDDPKKRMPLNQPALSADEIAKIENWVKDGAKNG